MDIGTSPSPFLADLLWLLTTGSETRRAAPHSVRLGVAAAAVYDLEQIGEVAWRGHAAAAILQVRATCRCEDPALRQWHDALLDASGGAALPARFTLSPLVGRAWLDVAMRLVASDAVSKFPRGRGVGRRTAFAVRDPAAITRSRHDLAGALERKQLDDVQHDLVAVAWASGCFDDLFHPYGWEAAAKLLDAARREVDEDATYGRLAAACAFSAAISDAGFTS